VGRHYLLVIQATDTRPGWRLNDRVVPHAYTIQVRKHARAFKRESVVEWVDLTDEEMDAIEDGAPSSGDDWDLGTRPWVEVDIESSATEPPRCVALRAAKGISTPELRFPLTGVVTEATAFIASRDGRFQDPPQDLEYEDVLFEASRIRGRKRTRQAVTPEHLAEIARTAREHPRAPTAAVQRRFGYSRGHARRLIKRSQEDETR
jgi:hypothetical protein